MSASRTYPARKTGPATETIRKSAQWQGENHVHQRGRHEEQGEIAEVELKLILQRQVDEAVAHGCQRQERTEDDDHSKIGRPEEPDGSAHRNTTPRRLPSDPAGSGRTEQRPRPRMAKKKLTTNTASNASGRRISSPNATSGPSIAPAVSSARWTPKAVPKRSGGELSEMIASRGAVLMPLPIRSIMIRPVSANHGPWIATKPSLVIADSPYPTAATSFWSSPAIGDKTAPDTDQHRSALIQPIDDPEMDWSEVKGEEQVERQDRGDHLGRDVGEEAVQTEQDHRAADHRPAQMPEPGPSTACQDLTAALDLVHATPRPSPRMNQDRPGRGTRGRPASTTCGQVAIGRTTSFSTQDS